MESQLTPGLAESTHLRTPSNLCKLREHCAWMAGASCTMGSRVISREKWFKIHDFAQRAFRGTLDTSRANFGPKYR